MKAGLPSRALVVSAAMGAAACAPVERVPLTVTDCATKEPLVGAQVSIEFGPAGFGNQQTTDDEGRVNARFPKEKPSRLLVHSEGYRMKRSDHRRPPEEPIEVCLEKSE